MELIVAPLFSVHVPVAGFTGSLKVTSNMPLPTCCTLTTIAASSVTVSVAVFDSTPPH